MGGVGEELVKIIAGGIVQGESGNLFELAVWIFELALFELGLRCKNALFCRGQDTIEPPKDRQRQDYVLVFAAFECVADQVGDTPKEAYDFAMIQELVSRSCYFHKQKSARVWE